MALERELIPYEATVLAGGQRVLVLAPHPDDETLGCGGALCLHRRAGGDVRVIFVASGGPGMEGGEGGPARAARAPLARTRRPSLSLGWESKLRNSGATPIAQSRPTASSSRESPTRSRRTRRRSSTRRAR